MPQHLNKIKPQVRALRAYTLSRDHASVKINQNENPYDVPATIKSEVLKRIGSQTWSRYPDFIPESFLERISRFARWPLEGLLVGNGSNELIQALLMVTLGQGNQVLICEPTFALYKQVATVLGASVLSVALTPDLRFDVRALVEAIQDTQPEVTVICSPNNPTGCVIDDQDLAQVLTVAQGIVAVDEAYHEFAEHSVVPLLNDYKNLVVLRTFSKAMALAGMRIGYLLAASELVEHIAKALLPYNLNLFSQTAAEVAIENYERELRPLIRQIISERQRVFIELQRIQGLQPIRSQGNFMLVHSTVNPTHVFTELLKRDILIRDVSSYPMLAQYFRVSVGTAHENTLLITALREIFQ